MRKLDSKATPSSLCGNGVCRIVKKNAFSAETEYSCVVQTATSTAGFQTADTTQQVQSNLITGGSFITLVKRQSARCFHVPIRLHIYTGMI